MDKEYTKKSSPHYDYFYFKDSLAEKEIEKIIDIQESAYQKILKFLNVKNDRKIKYYLYPSNKIKGEITGDDGNGHTVREKFEVHAVYTDKVKCIGAHEDTHLLSTTLGLPPQLLREGLAEYMSGTWDGKSHDEWASQFLIEDKMLDLLQIIDDEEWYEQDDTISYPSAGSFVGYLIKKLGKEKFLELYRALNRDFSPKKNEAIFQKITDSIIQEIQTAWQNDLENK